MVVILYVNIPYKRKEEKGIRGGSERYLVSWSLREKLLHSQYFVSGELRNSI